MSKIYKGEPCPKCGNYTNRGVSVDAVIIKNGKVLLIKRGVDPFKGYWGTPGGYVDWDETIEETVKREVKEETDLDVSDLRLVGVYSSPKRHPKQVINLVYLIGDFEGIFKVSDDATQGKWFRLDSLPREMAFDHKQNIMDSLHILKK